MEERLLLASGTMEDYGEATAARGGRIYMC